MLPGLASLVNVTTVLLGATAGRPARKPATGTDQGPGHRRPRPGHPADRRDLRDGGALPRPVRRGRRQRADADRARLAAASAGSPARCCGSSSGSRGSAAGCSGGWPARPGSAERARFIEGFVVSSLVFCTGPLTILGSLNDGLGNGADQILLKSVLDGFAAVAFAASFGWGVAASAVTIVVVQGGLTLVGRRARRRAARRAPRRDHRGRRAAAGRRGAAAAPDPRDPGGRPAAGAAGRAAARRGRGRRTWLRPGCE